MKILGPVVAVRRLLQIWKFKTSSFIFLSSRSLKWRWFDCFKQKCFEKISNMCSSSCAAQPTNDLAMTRRMEKSGQYILNDMAQVDRKTYVLSDCAMHPSYGLTETRKVEYVLNHAPGGMVGVVSKCIRQPSYCVSDIRKVNTVFFSACCGVYGSE